MRRWSAIVLAGAVLCATAAFAPTPVQAQAQPQNLAGPARVIDGDTLEVRGQSVRLFGIDAPERDQACRDGAPCGAAASAYLSGLVGNRIVACRPEDRDRYGRIVATCFVGGRDLGREIVRAGHALPYTAFSQRYVRDVRAPVRFAEPWAWRRGDTWAPVANRVAETPDNDTCAVKGNVASSGERIYHVPGGQSYRATRIEAAKGERWFCSEAEARAAGWRRARR